MRLILIPLYCSICHWIVEGFQWHVRNKLSPMGLVVRDDYRSERRSISNINKYHYIVHDDDVSACSYRSTICTSLRSTNSDDDKQLTIQNVDKNNKKDETTKGPNKMKNKLKIMISIVNYYLSQRIRYIKRKLTSKDDNNNINSNSNNNNNNRNNRSNNNALKVFLMKVQVTMSKPINIVKAVLTIIFSLVIRKLVWLRRTLIIEIPFSKFIDVLNTSPERINTVRITPSMLFFMLDGVHALTRTVPLEPSLLDKLVHSRIEFYAPAAPKNVLGLLWTVGKHATVATVMTML